MAIVTVYIIIHLTDLIYYKKDGIHKYLLASKRNIFRNINQIYVSFPGGVLDMMIPFEDGMMLAYHNDIRAWEYAESPKKNLLKNGVS